MSVTVENIVAAHGHIACGIRETQDGREPGARGNSRFPLHFVSHLLKPDAALTRTFRASAPRFFELRSGGKPAASSEVAR
jgi:hypothetical protein